MRNANKLNTERAEIDDVARLNPMEQDIAEQVVLFQFAFGQAGSEVRTVNRNVKSLQEIRQGAEMIFVAVREHYRGDVVAILFEEFKVRNGDVNTIGRLFRKAHPGVEYQHLVAVPQSHAVHPKLADTAERDDL
jgi:hypothetical protein